MNIHIDRTVYNVGDQSTFVGRDLRALAQVPEDRDLWQETGRPSRDRKVTDDIMVFLGSGYGQAPCFHTAPRHI